MITNCLSETEPHALDAIHRILLCAMVMTQGAVFPVFLEAATGTIVGISRSVLTGPDRENAPATKVLSFPLANRRTSMTPDESHRGPNARRVLCLFSDLVDQPVYLGGGEQADVVFLEDSLDARPTVRMPGAELSEDDQLELAELRVRAVVQRLALDGISTSGNLGLLRIRGLKRAG